MLGSNNNVEYLGINIKGEVVCSISFNQNNIQEGIKFIKACTKAGLDVINLNDLIIGEIKKIKLRSPKNE